MIYTLLYSFISIQPISGSTAEYGCTSAPTISPAPFSPTVVPAPTPVTEDDTRLIAYLGNWQSCPSLDQVAPYTHIVIAFAVSYTWSPSKNNCSPTCEISTPPVCGNAGRQDLIDQWRAMGKKVILSFGGAGMGGSWAGDNNDCWEQCYGREDQVTDRLVEIVEEMNLDGVDLDFEYHVTPKATIFLNQVTLGLRNKMPTGSELTHAPMDSDIMPGKPYYDDVLMITGGQLDFLMPQYYNGPTRPVLDGVGGTGVGSESALSHYASIVNNVYGGDAKRMVFGFCISDCSFTSSNANALQASTVMTDLANTHPCNGGAFFWVAQHDLDGAWSSSVSSTINTLASTGCASSPTTLAPTPNPTPVTTPVPTPNPTPVTTPAPTPNPTPNPTPVTTPAPTPNPTPVTTPNPTPNPTPVTTPAPTPNPTPVTTPAPTPNPTPVTTPAPTPNPTPVTTPNPTPAPTPSLPTTGPGPMCCEPNENRFKAYNECTQYYRCVLGEVQSISSTSPNGALFNEAIQNWAWPGTFTCSVDSCGGGGGGDPNPTPAPTPVPITPAPTPVPTTSGGGGGDPCCPAGYTGMKAWNGCTQFYHCTNGAVNGDLKNAPAGTLFSEAEQNNVWSWRMEACVIGSCGRRGLRGSN